MLRELLILLFFSMTTMLSSGQTLIHMKINPDPTSCAMGGGSLACTSPAYAAFGNIASLVFDDSPAQFSCGDVIWQPTIFDSNIMCVSGAGRLSDRMSISTGVEYMLNRQYEIIDTFGNYIRDFRPHDAQIRVGLSYLMHPMISIGVNMAYAFSLSSPGHYYNAVASDFFLMGKLGMTSLIVGVTDIGLCCNNRFQFSEMPTSTALSLRYDVLLTDTQLITAEAKGGIYFTGGAELSGGVSYTYDNLVSLRFGGRYGFKGVVPSCMTYGFSLTRGRISFSTSYISYVCNDYMTGAISMSLSYCL